MKNVFRSLKEYRDNNFMKNIEVEDNSQFKEKNKEKYLGYVKKLQEHKNSDK